MVSIRMVTAALLCAPALAAATPLEDLLVARGVISRGEAASPSAAGGVKTYWNKGTRLEFSDTGFTVGINTFVQSRYTFTDNDADGGKGNTSSFSVKRARLIVTGTALNEEFAYKLEGDFVGGKGADGAAASNLKDGFIEWRMSDSVAVRLGQFKTNLGRQHLNSDTSLQFIDRSVASDYFSLDRQNGALVSSKLAGGEVVVSAGIFNGESDGESGSNRPGVDTNHTGIVSVRWNPIGKMNALEEGDIDWTEELALSFGAAYGRADSNNDIVGALEKVNRDLVSVDANLKYQGWSVHTELFTLDEQVEESDRESDPLGFYAQIGYFFEPKTIEAAARYSYLDCDDGAAGGDCEGNESIGEVSAGLSYFWWKHHLKAQANYVRTEEDGVAGGADVTTNKWMMQLSAFF